MIEDVWRPRRLPGFRQERAGDEVVIRDADARVVARLNASASALFELCDGATTIEEIIQAVCDVSAMSPEKARDDVLKTLSDLAAARLVVLDS